ncbi:AbrB/MazE/SpoVT family DNA-binding domain-containing protein, partial [Shigella sonnei]
QGCAPKPANNLSATGYHPMPSEYDEQLDSTDTQLPGEYDLFDLMAQVTEENLHAPVDFGSPVGREAL